MEDILKILAGALLGAIPGLTALYLGRRKQLTEERKVGSELSTAEKEVEQQLAMDREDHVVGHLRKMMEERRKSHEKDMERVETMLGAMGRKLDDCEKKHVRAEIINTRLVEFMRVRNLMTESQEHDLFRGNEDDSDAGA